MIMHYQIDEETMVEAVGGLESKPSDPNETGERVEAALARHASGEPLAECEWTIVQYALGGGCHACGGQGVRVAVRLPGSTSRGC
jgi:hypothetical protein